MTEFKVGTRVRVLPGEPFWQGREGWVLEDGNYPHYLRISLIGVGLACLSPLDLEVIEDSAEPAKPVAKPECYVTAWVYRDGGGYALTDHEAAFTSKEAAEAHAKALLEDEVATTSVAVFKMVSKHSSAVTVTSEDV